MIRFEKVTKTYPGSARPALDQVSIDIEKGEFVFLVGPPAPASPPSCGSSSARSGAATGRCTSPGKDLARLSDWKVPQMRRQLGDGVPGLPAAAEQDRRENVAFAQEVIGKSRGEIRKSVPQMLDLVGLGGKEDRMPGELSGGEQQRVAIARAFVNRPKLLIADEPTGNLDPQTSVGIMKLLDRINRTGTTVVMATHDQNIVDQMRKRVIELEQGRLVRDQARGVYGGAV